MRKLILVSLVYFMISHAEAQYQDGLTINRNNATCGGYLSFLNQDVRYWTIKNGVDNCSTLGDMNFINSSKNEVMTIFQNGRIGIGTTAPTDQLQISSTSAHDIFSLQRINTSNGNTYDFRISSNSNGQNYLAPRSLSIVATEHAADIALIANPSVQEPQFILKSSGQVCIGTTDFSGNHKLRVEGSIGAREIKVEATGWSDFVFEENHILRSLEETEKYIAENNHLPEIPSEEEVTQNGINLGEMDAKLLQKIEELTLYMIEMNKRMKQLETENTQLKEKYQSLENE